MAVSKSDVALIDDSLRREMRQLKRDLNEDGLQVIAAAYKETKATQHCYSVNDEAGMTFIGFLSFLDPPKESVAEAIRALAEHGVVVKVLTGDNDIVAHKICKVIGLNVRRTMLCGEIEEKSDEELAVVVEQTIVFAKLSPVQKASVVRALRSKGHTVGFLGDGINDAPALRTAGVGISVASEVDITYLLQATCRDSEEPHVRAHMLQELARESLRLKSLSSEDINSSGKVRVEAELITTGRSDKLIEQVISRLSMERGITAVSWEIVEQRSE